MNDVARDLEAVDVAINGYGLAAAAFAVVDFVAGEPEPCDSSMGVLTVDADAVDSADPVHRAAFDRYIPARRAPGWIRVRAVVSDPVCASVYLKTFDGDEADIFHHDAEAFFCSGRISCFLPGRIIRLYDSCFSGRRAYGDWSALRAGCALVELERRVLTAVDDHLGSGLDPAYCLLNGRKRPAFRAVTCGIASCLRDVDLTRRS